MDDTYAQLENTYAEISMDTPRRRDSRHFNRHLRRDQFDSGLPIEFRYPKRSSLTSSAMKQRSLASKGSSSGYSSSGSVSSITTVVNGAEPYRPKSEVTETSMMNRLAIEESSGDEEERTPNERPCCIECREKEIRAEADLESHQYANLQSIKKPQDPYVFLMTSMLTSLQKEEGGRKVSKIQQKIEKVLRMKPREPFKVDHKPTFDLQIASFASDVQIRFRAISDVAPETYREVSAKFCEALHHGGPNSKGLKGIVKGVKNLLSL